MTPSRRTHPPLVPLPGGRRLLVLAVGARSSGIPPGWAATADLPGAAYVRRALARRGRRRRCGTRQAGPDRPVT
ncbi:hypothetical protein SVIOM74S_03619 [Streptomyces violarus]